MTYHWSTFPKTHVFRPAKGEQKGAEEFPLDHEIGIFAVTVLVHPSVEFRDAAVFSGATSFESVVLVGFVVSREQENAEVCRIVRPFGLFARRRRWNARPRDCLGDAENLETQKSASHGKFSDQCSSIGCYKDCSHRRIAYLDELFRLPGLTDFCENNGRVHFYIY